MRRLAERERAYGERFNGMQQRCGPFLMLCTTSAHRFRGKAKEPQQQTDPEPAATGPSPVQTDDGVRSNPSSTV
jgi:hypothetical protein